MKRVPDETHSGNLNRTKVPATGREGAEKASGKTNNPDSVITDARVLKKAPEAVRQASSTVYKQKVDWNADPKQAGVTDCCCDEDKD